MRWTLRWRVAVTECCMNNGWMLTVLFFVPITDPLDAPTKLTSHFVMLSSGLASVYTPLQAIVDVEASIGGANVECRCRGPPPLYTASLSHNSHIKMALPTQRGALISLPYSLTAIQPSTTIFFMV